MAESGSFAVVLSRPEDVRSPLLAELLAKHDHVPFADAARRALVSWGIALEQAPENAARELASFLSAGGLPAAAVGHDRLRTPPPWEQAVAAMFEPGVIRWHLHKQGDVRDVPDAHVEIIAAAVYREETSKTVKVKEGPTSGQKMASFGIMMTTGLPIHIGGKEREVEKVEKKSELVYHLDLLSPTPPLRIRLDSEKFNYTCLGPKMLYGAAPNFRALLLALRERLPKSRLNLGARTLIAGQPIATLGYENDESLEREERWLLSI